MLYVTITDAHQNVVGRAEIRNTGDHAERPEYGDYVAIIYKPGPHGLEYDCQTRVLDYRRSDGAWKLLRLALDELAGP